MSIQPLYTTPDKMTPTGHFTELLFVEDQLQIVLEKADGSIKQTCITLLQSGGKRIRPLLTLYSGMCFAPLNQAMIQAAVAAELIHMASLIHDDVIDESATRRGKPTVNSLYGNHAAILTGDYLFAEAFKILSSHQLLKSMTYLVEAIQAMCHGEVNQANEQFASSGGKEQYFNRIANKTAIFLAACCQSGAYLAGTDAENVFLMRDYGLNVGYAYQITDDILDITGSEDSLGKPVGADIMNGNVTLPLIYLLEDPVYGNWLKELLSIRRLTSQGAQSITEALIRTGSLRKAQTTAIQCIDHAKACLDTVSLTPYKSTLLELADSVISRRT